MTGGNEVSWRRWRPAIWLVLFGVAALCLVNPLVGILLLGAALGVALRIASGRRPGTLRLRRNHGRSGH